MFGRDLRGCERAAPARRDVCSLSCVVQAVEALERPPRVAWMVSRVGFAPLLIGPCGPLPSQSTGPQSEI